MFFWNSLFFSMIQKTLAVWSLVPLPFLNPAWTSGSSQFMYYWILAWRILSITPYIPAIPLLIIYPKNRKSNSKVYKSVVTQSCDHSVILLGSSIHGIFQARILEWVAISFSRASSGPRDWLRPPTLWADSLPSEPPGNTSKRYRHPYILCSCICNSQDMETT